MYIFIFLSLLLADILGLIFFWICELNFIATEGNAFSIYSFISCSMFAMPIRRIYRNSALHINETPDDKATTVPLLWSVGWIEVLLAHQDHDLIMCTWNAVFCNHSHNHLHLDTGFVDFLPLVQNNKPGFLDCWTFVFLCPWHRKLKLKCSCARQKTHQVICPTVAASSENLCSWVYFWYFKGY